MKIFNGCDSCGEPAVVYGNGGKYCNPCWESSKREDGVYKDDKSMYDIVYGLSVTCQCGKEISEFKTYCRDNVLDRIHYSEVGSMFCTCDCGSYLGIDFGDKQ